MFTMLKKLHVDLGDMALALTLWLCSLPLIALVVIPLFGLRVAAIVALVAFFVAMTICWGICGWKLAQKGTPNK